MDSIHRDQPEHHRQDLAGRKAVERIEAVVDVAKTCFFRTSIAKGDTQGVRPMNVRKVDEAGNLWFLGASDTHLVQELSQDPAVDLFFQGSPNSDFLHLSGTATMSRDKAKIHELWEPILRTWFTEGEDDPRITVIQVTPREGYYWDNKHGDVVAGIKMMFGAISGKTLDDSIEGKIQV